jgi:hypothetical protein
MGGPDPGQKAAISDIQDSVVSEKVTPSNGIFTAS